MKILSLFLKIYLQICIFNLLFILGRVIYVLPKEKEEQSMELMCLAADRKELVDAINTITGGKMKYQGPPSYAYKGE